MKRVYFSLSLLLVYNKHKNDKLCLIPVYVFIKYFFLENFPGMFLFNPKITQLK